MSLKYKFTNEPNPNYNEEAFKKYLATEIKLLKAKEHFSQTDIVNSSLIENVKSNIDIQLKRTRKKIKEVLNEPKFISKVKVTSDKEWTLYPEYIGEDCGRTKYIPSIKFKVDTEIDYSRKIPSLDNNGNQLYDENGQPIFTHGNIKEALTVARDNALAPLKEFRKKSKEIQFVERELNIAGMPYKPKYKVYAGNGYGGGESTYPYIDAWSGYNGMMFTKPAQNENFFIHMEGGTFLKLQEVARTRKVFERKSPRTNEHHVGIELEFISKMDELELATELCKENVQDFVFLTDDPSIRFTDKNGNHTETPVDDFQYSHELTMVAPEPLVHEVIRRVLKAINRDGKSKVGGRCGFHVHLDMRNRDKKLAFHNLSKAQLILYAMNPRSRLDGTDSKGKKGTQWSKKLDVSDFDQALNVINNDPHSRYFGINIQALSKHNTIEIRIHTGSTNEEKVSNWVKILTNIVNKTERVEVEAHKPETFCKYYELDQTMCEYIKLRINKFKDKEGNHITVDEAA